MGDKIFDKLLDKSIEQDNKIKRLQTLLVNAIILLENEDNMNCTPKSERLLNELGMTEEEYIEIMGEEDCE